MQINITKLRESTCKKTVVAAFSVFTLTYLITFVACSIFAPSASSDAATVNASVDVNGYYVSTTSSDIDMEIIATPTGKVVTAKDTLLTKTNNPSGYKLYLSMENSSNLSSTSGKTVPGNALLLDGESASGIFISPTAGTFSAPASLSDNSWGFSLSGEENDFASVPLLSSPQRIQTTASANEEGVSQDIWYGVKANMAMESGAYSNTVVYSATADASSSQGATMALSPSSTASLDGGETVVIKTAFYANYDFSSSDVTATIGGKTCRVTGVSRDATLKTMTVTCVTPALEKGKYDVVVSVPMYGETLTLTSGYQVSPDFYHITKMQDMTPEICAAVTTPTTSAGTSTSTIDTTGAHKGDSAYVAQATLYDYRGIDGTGTRSNPASGSNAVSYTVRKLADGNCWMADNLKLTLSTSRTYEVSTNTGGTATWRPTGSGGTSNAATPMNGNTLCTGSGSSKNCWYNWYAATAGSGTASQSSGDATNSICPMGWRLPSRNGTTSDYNLIFTIYGIRNNSSAATKLESLPMSYTRHSMYTDGVPISDLTGRGDYVGSTAYNAEGFYHFGYSSSYAQYTPTDKYRGASVRCVAIP